MPELIWDGKYDATGKRPAPLRVALPFQTVETVNESMQERQRSLFFAGPESTGWRNRLIWGDKKYVLPSLLEEFAGAVDLIYIDPPFATGDDFSYIARVPGYESDDDDSETIFTKEPGLIEQKAYRDTWRVSPEAQARGANSLDPYLRWFSEAALNMRELLSSSGSLFVHLDWHVSHYAKAVLDEIFASSDFSGV